MADQKIERADLLAALSLAKSSLGSADGVLPVLSHFCFDDDIVYAYDDITAVVAPLKTGLRCALHGTTLHDIIGVTGVGTIAVRMEKDFAQMDVGTGQVRVPMLPPETFIFAFPNDPDVIAEIPIDEGMRRGLELCAMTVGSDSLKPEYSGVSVHNSKDGLFLYSTDNHNASRYALGKQVGKKTCSFVLPPTAVDQLLKLAAGQDKEVAKLQVCNDIAWADFDNGASLVTKLLEAKLEMFHKVFKDHADDAHYFPIPTQLTGEVAKAVVLLAKDTQKSMHVGFSGGSIHVNCQGARGSMKTIIAHADKKAKGSMIIDAVGVQKTLGLASHMAVVDSQSLVFQGGGYTRVVAALGPATANTEPDKKAGSGMEDLEDDIPF